MRGSTKASLVVLFFALACCEVLSAQVAKFGEIERGGDYQSYIAQDGTQYNIGDKLKIGMPQGGNRVFSFVLQSQFMADSIPCPAECAGLEYEIIGFRAGGRRQGFRVWARMKGEGRFNAALSVNFENALQSGELIGYGYTSDQALQELRKAKDMLELELITQEEYDRKKEELSKYIR